MSDIIGSDRDPSGGDPPKQDEPKSTRLVMILALAGLISGIGIVGIFEVTLETITANKARELRAAVFKVLPGVTQMQQLAQENNQLIPVQEDEASDNTIYGGYDEEQNFVGYAIPGASRDRSRLYSPDNRLKSRHPDHVHTPVGTDRKQEIQ